MNQQGATVGARWEKVGQGWRRVKPYIGRGLLRGLIGLAVAGAILALYFIPKMQVPVCPPGKDGLPLKICFDIENEARKTLAYILAGVLAIIGIYMAHRRIRALERQVQIGQDQLQVAQEGQITERFTRAIEQLGSDKMEIRLGGIYALERIANDSDKDYWPIMETLTAYVRENFSWRGLPPEEAADPVDPASPAFTAPPKPATDLQAILTVLGRRKYRFGQGETQPLDLGGTDLGGANLRGAHLEGALLRWSHLERAILSEAHLERAFLIEAHLEGAILIGAHLEGAGLPRANLKEADLRGAHLGEADLIEAYLEDAILRWAHLEGAILRGAELKGADLIEACMEGTILWEATGLTREQLAQAFLDEKTILPDYLQEQPPEDKGPEGNDEE